MARGFIRVDLERYGTLRLEKKCRPLLRGEETIELRKDVKLKAARKKIEIPLSGRIDASFWEALGQCRRNLAESQGVPPYVIFHDCTLQAMAELLPQTLDEFGQLSGVGETNWRNTGSFSGCGSW